MASKAQHKQNNSLSTGFQHLEELLKKIEKDPAYKKDAQAGLAALAQISSPTDDSQQVVGTWSWDLESGEIEWSKETYLLFGLDPKTPIELKTYWKCIHPEDLELLRNAMERSVQRRVGFSLKHRVIRPSGEVVWMDCAAKTEGNKKNVLRVHGICRIATNLIAAPGNPVNTHQIIADNANDIIAHVDADGKILNVNLSVFEELDWYPNELMGLPIWEIIAPDQHKTLVSALDSAPKHMGKVWQGNVRLMAKNGAYKWFLVKAIPVQNLDGTIQSMHFVAENATRQKLIRSTSVNSGSKFSSIGEEISEFAIITVDLNAKIQLWNQGAKRIFKAEQGEVIGTVFTNFMKTTGLEKKEPDDLFFDVKEGHKKREWYGWMVVKDDADFWGHLIITPQIDPEDQTVFGFTLLVRNLSERKFSDARFQSFLEMGSDSTVIIDEEGKIYLVNRRTEETFGYKREELLGQSIDILVPDSYKAAHGKHRKKYFTNPSARPMGQGLELYAKKKNGDIFPVEISLSPVETEKGTLVLSSIRDVSQRLENERKLMNAARELNLSYQRLQGIIDSSQDFIAAVDVNYNFIAFNKAFKQNFDSDFNTNILAGDNIKSIFQSAPEDKRVLEGYWERAFKGQEFSFVLKDRNASGSEKYLNVTFNSIRDQNKRLLGAAHVIRDITEEFRQKEILKRSEEMLNDAQEFARIGSFEYDIKLKEIYCSDGLYDLIGIVKQEISADAELLRLVHVDDRKELSEAFITLIQQGKPFHRLVHVKRIDDGEIVVLSCSARSRITANGNPGIIGVIQDETQDYRIQEELKSAKNKAEETAKLKQTFVANVSHEIRTPMNAILGFSRFLMEDDLTLEQKDFATSIYSSAENLLVLIDDILDFSKLEAGKVRMEQTEFSIRDTITQVRNLFNLKSKQKGVEIRSEVGDEVAPAYLGDPYRINQMIVNLVGNAVKFTERGSINISVSVTKKKKEKHILSIAVRDTGIGIPKNKLNTIFQSFSQAEGNTTRKYGGSGLGLSIVRNLLEVLKGDISVESKVGEGSTFTLKIPLQLGDPTKLKKSDQVAVDLKSGKGHQILLAEDNANNQIITAKLLRDVGFEVLVAGNGEEAIELFKEHDVQVILMDIQMPVMDGLEAMLKIRKMGDRGKEIPIVALTAHALVEEKERYLQSGMTDYLSKPFKPENLYQTVFTYFDIPEADNTKSKPLKVYSDDTRANETKTVIGKNPSDVPVDLSYLREMVGEDKDVIQEMLDIFKEDTPVYLKAIRDNLKLENWEPIAKNCHTLKSSIGFMGRSDLVEMAQLLQQQKSKPATDDPVRKTLNKFMGEVEQVVRYVQNNPDLK